MLMACQALEADGILGIKNRSCQPGATAKPTAQTGKAGEDTSMHQELPAQGAEPAVALDLTSTAAESSAGSPGRSAEALVLPEVETTGRAGESNRKRQRQKSTVSPQGVGEPPAAQPDNSEASERGADDSQDGGAAAFAAKDERAKRMYIGNRLRRRAWYQKYQQEIAKRQKKVRHWPSRWTALPAGGKEAFVKWWARQPDNDVCASVAKWAAEHFWKPTGQLDGMRVPRSRNKNRGQVLLTYQGAWGEIDEVGIVSPPQITLALTAQLQRMTSVQKLWEKILVGVERISRTTLSDDWAATLEICNQMLAVTGKVRLHVHLALSRKAGHIELGRASSQLLDSRPHVSSSCPNLAKKGKAASAATMYYCSVEKVGQVFMKASTQPHTDYPVNAEWTWTLMACDKIHSRHCSRRVR